MCTDLASSLFSPIAATTITIRMASGGGTICLACAEPVKKVNRRILGASNSTEVTVLWKEVISRDIEKRGVNLDLEQLIQKEAYICRSCFNIYDKLLEKQKVSPTQIYNLYWTNVLFIR